MDDGRVAQAPCDCIARHRWASRQPYSCALRISRTVAMTLQPPRPEPGIRAFADQRGIEPGMYTRKYEVGPMVSVRRSRLQGEDLRQRRNGRPRARTIRSEEHTSEVKSLMRNSYAVFCLKKKKKIYAKDK